MTTTAAPQRRILSRLGAPALLLLAVASHFWPDPAAVRGDGTLLVLLPEQDPRRVDAVTALADHLAARGRLDLRIAIACDRAAFIDELPGALMVLCPDGLAMSLPAVAWQPLAVGRRRVPWNLRPTSVLVTRLPEQAGAAPWLTQPGRTVFGDSLSLACLAPLCTGAGAETLPAGVTWGADPFDHRGVLDAARYGAFDHAVVRQWDAEQAFASGRLDRDAWQIRRLSEPLPDLVVLASRRLAQGVRLDLQEALTVLGRHGEERPAGERSLEAQLGLVGLEGFNLLLSPDFDRVRHRYGPCWPRLVD